MITAMILAGGNGSRVGADRPKQFIEVLGRPILAYTIDIYEKNSKIDAIEIVCHKEWIGYVKNIVSEEKMTKVKWIVVGGKTFLESVICGINGLEGYMEKNDIVMIHYGASPLTSQEIIEDSIRVCNEHNMSVSCTPCYQLMGNNEEMTYSSSFVDRDKIIQLCCPQSFEFLYLKELFSRGKGTGLLNVVEPHITSLMYELGDKIYLSYGNQANIKITTKDDILFFEIIARGMRNS